MTKKDALTIAINSIDNEEVKSVLTNMVAQLEKPRKISDEAKAAASAKRKAETAANRAAFVNAVAPVLRKYLTADMTAKELFAAAQSELPAAVTAPQIQNILLREMAPELIKTETKGKPNTYRLAN